MIRWVPAVAVGVYVTAQLALVEVGLARVHVPPVPNVPAAPLTELAVSRAKVTVPVGADLMPASVSVTVTVHVVAELRKATPGLQLRAVVVERVVTLTSV